MCAVNNDAHTSSGPEAPGPDGLIDELHSLHRRAREQGVAEPFELYHRASVTLRVRRDQGEASPQLRTGREDGMAIRWPASDAGPLKTTI